MKTEIIQPEDRFVTRIFQLQFVSPRDVQAALINMASFPQNVLSIESAGLLIATDFDYNIKRFEEIIKIMDIKKPDIELKLIPLKNAIAAEVEQMMGGLVQTMVGRQTPPRPPASRRGRRRVVRWWPTRTNSVIPWRSPTACPSSRRS